MRRRPASSSSSSSSWSPTSSARGCAPGCSEDRRMATGLRARRGALAWLIAGALALAACGPGAGERAQEHRRKGTALLREGQYAAAVGELQKAVELDRDSAEAHTELGNAYRGLKQYDKAFEAYRAAKKVDRYVTRPHIENARALIE